MYTVRPREDRDSINVIASNFTTNDIPYFTLINNGSTYSYVSCVMADKLRIQVEDIVSNVTILSPLG